jgi:hypothetical protein
LTKGRLPGSWRTGRDFRGQPIRISLVSLDEGFRKKWEPGAAPYADRVAALRFLHKRAVQPMCTSSPTLLRTFWSRIGKLLGAVDFAESFYFGGWNYNAQTVVGPGARSSIGAAAVVARFCRERSIECRLGS